MSSLTDRYRTPTSLTTKLLVGLGAVALVALVVWFVWALWLNSTPKATSDLGINYAVDDNHYQVNVVVTLGKNVDPSTVHCQGNVEAKDGSVVGDPGSWTPPHAGANTFTITTTRRGVYLDWEGCDAPGQQALR